MSGTEIIKHRDGTVEVIKVNKKTIHIKPDPNKPHGEIRVVKEEN